MDLEVADIFRDHGAAWREANRGHLSLGQLKVMSAIECCRTAALGGHVMRCENDACGYTAIAYNSCRNRHCPKCQGAAAREWMEARAAELLPVPPAFAGAGYISTWCSHCRRQSVPGGGVSLDGSRWITKRPRFLLPVRVLSKLFRRLMIEKLVAAHAAGQLTFQGAHAALVNTQAFAAYLAPLKRTRWYVYAKRPLAGPKAVLAYLSRYTHRVAISNRRLIAADAKTVTFKVKDYRINGPARYKTMTLDVHEFIRRFLIHVLPTGFHRIRHYGLLASGVKADNLVLARKLLDVAPPAPGSEDIAAEPPTPLKPCPCCGSAMHIIEVFKPGEPARHRPAAMPAAIWIESS